MSTLTRETKETRVRVALGSVRNGGPPDVTTDVEFLTHMLITLARYADWGLEVDATGDLPHHLIEDVAITLGAVAGKDTPATCVRYGEATVPMDDALVQVAIDTGGRPHFEGELPSALYDHFFRSFALNADWTVHVRVIRGRDRHHVVEAAFKALGLAIRQAMAETGAVFSTKGSVAEQWDDGLDESDLLGPEPGQNPGGGSANGEPTNGEPANGEPVAGSSKHGGGPDAG